MIIIHILRDILITHFWCWHYIFHFSSVIMLRQFFGQIPSTDNNKCSLLKSQLYKCNNIQKASIWGKSCFPSADIWLIFYWKKKEVAEQHRHNRTRSCLCKKQPGASKAIPVNQADRAALPSQRQSQVKHLYLPVTLSIKLPNSNTTASKQLRQSV